MWRRSYRLWFEKQVITVKIISNDSATPEAVTIITTETASKKRETRTLNKLSPVGNTHFVHASVLLQGKLNDDTNLKTQFQNESLTRSGSHQMC